MADGSLSEIPKRRVDICVSPEQQAIFQEIVDPKIFLEVLRSLENLGIIPLERFKAFDIYVASLPNKQPPELSK